MLSVAVRPHNVMLIVLAQQMDISLDLVDKTQLKILPAQWETKASLDLINSLVKF